ncbi:hypothetical protein EMIHUDRAFT_450732 [Emiliania huxleyi CCMP1516]|uniref:WW domain-containing protein n=2 Tax=Emiliania huxleyi TaxID=2903 RepID=A0A0D3JFF8_EMIH1|nr:hypothetical protein EMIHUDRAFT_450732 [Emiliania huxleyi CCMP1516]EOD22243.1 hypothetical protein EMIHUDRAFT_450732 [Emiliania huxleyi CCMP1516]|eukprot:XP_005774672.1 hypothetical protein EMIHUDRAFT_450732 [Emiliania huxleyi CCMP1516]
MLEDPPLPADWATAVDPHTGATYYYSAELQRSSWVRPAPRPATTPAELRAAAVHAAAARSHERHARADARESVLAKVRAKQHVAPEERKEWLQAQQRTEAIERGSANAESFGAIICQAMERPVAPLSAFAFDESALKPRTAEPTAAETRTTRTARAGARAWFALRLCAAPSRHAGVVGGATHARAADTPRAGL